MISRFIPFSSYGTSVDTPVTETLKDLTGAQLYKLELLQTTDGKIYISKPVVREDASAKDDYKNNGLYPVFAKGKINTNIVTEFWKQTQMRVPDGNDDSAAATGDENTKKQAIEKIQKLLNEAVEKIKGLTSNEEYTKFIDDNEKKDKAKIDPIIKALTNSFDGSVPQTKDEAINKLKNAIEASDGFSDVIDIDDKKAITKKAADYVEVADITEPTAGGGNNYVYLSAPANKKYPKNVTFSKKNPRKRMNAKSVRKLQNILNT